MKVVVNGMPFEGVSMHEADLELGALVRWKMSRCAYRIVCFDGDDAILRNVRKPSLLEAAPRCAILEDCLLLVPA